MIDQKFDDLLSGAVETALETMFFSTPLGPAEPETGNAVLEARMAFRGDSSGTFGVRLSAPCARVLAAGFLGEDEEMLADSQPGEVVCELANILCGSLLGNLESQEPFDLSSPELVPVANPEAAGSETHSAVRHNVPEAPVVRMFSKSFELENGILTATLHVAMAE